MKETPQARVPLQAYLAPRLLIMLPLGFASGLPLALTASTLAAWLNDSGVDITLIGLFAAVAIPYSVKFLWAPLVDGFRFPVLSRLGRRRSWLLATQLMLFALIAFAALLDPAADTALLACLAIAVALVSATQDVAVDAYRVERLAPEELGPGTAVFTLGYRLGMLASGAGALFLADRAGWHMAYLLMAALMGVGMVATLFGKEPSGIGHLAVGIGDATPMPNAQSQIPSFLRRAVIAPFADFMQREGWGWMLLFIAVYKLGDAFLGNMTNPFLLEIGFTKSQIAAIVKLYGFTATIIGTFAGGWLCTRFGTLKPLLLTGLFHALTNLMFVWQARAGADSAILALGITLENFTGGMSSAVLVVFISTLTHREFTATQYALLSSLAALGRTTLSSSAGYLVAWLGWEMFFVLCVLLALPGLLMLPVLRRYSPRP
jgi:PAT family beta-lactamase induction signal transducer AmpG